MSSRVRDDLPVVIERVAFSQRRNDDAAEGDDEEPADHLQSNLVRSSPHLLGQFFQELADGELGSP